MPTYQDLLAEVKSQITEISAADAAARLSSDEPPVLIDVREPDEFDQGAIDGSVHIPRGNLESRIGALVPDLSTPIVISCQSGARSAFAARSLEELGYEDVASLAGGFGGWKQNGFPWSTPSVLSEAQRARYSRHTLIPEVGEAGQLKLLDSKVLLVGAGGLGSPAGLYLAAAGVGTIAIVDADIVDESNLQRQVLHSMASIGVPKVESARQRIEELNPDVRVISYQERLTSENIDRDARGRRRDRRRHRQLPHALPAQRRQPAPPHPGRARIDLPLRGPAHGLPAVRGPVLPLPLPAAAAARARAVVRRGRRARRAAGHHGLAAGQRGAQAPARHRRAARPAA